ncbi:hypothetical protein V6N13_118387 [Hibiscus sabdariffa]
MDQNSDKKNSINLNCVERKEDGSVNLMGLAVDSQDAAYNMYRDYGHGMGFSIRKGKNMYVSGTNVIRFKEFYCSKEGFKEFEDDINTKQYNKLETRTGCHVMIRFTVQDNRWIVTHFISEHNHELATPSKRHLLRSARSLSTDKANVINSMVSAGIRPTDVYSYMSNEACGSENVGFTKRDCYNYVNKQKMMVIEAGDGQSLLNHFKRAEVTNNVLHGNVRRSLIESLSEDGDVIENRHENNNSSVLDPPCVRPKGISNTRLKGHLDKRKSKASKPTKQKKAKQSTIKQSLDTVVGTAPNHENFVIPSMLMPVNDIYRPLCQNTMQFSNMGSSTSWYSTTLNMPHRVVQQNNGATALNMSQTSSEWRMNESNMFYTHNFGYAPNIQESYKHSGGHPNPKL